MFFGISMIRMIDFTSSIDQAVVTFSDLIFDFHFLYVILQMFNVYLKSKFLKKTLYKIHPDIIHINCG